jgi:hypothetical protein
LKYKNENDLIQIKEKKRIKKNKQILEDLEKIVRSIYTYKTYAIFVHNVLGVPFPFPYEVKNEFTYSDSKEKDKELELKVNKILKDFEGTNITSYTPTILEDTAVLCSKFVDLEETVLKMIEKKHQTDKELKGFNEKQKEEIVELKKREISLIEERNKLIFEQDKVKKDLNVLNYKNVEGDNQEHLKYIYTLYRVSINSEYDVNNKTSTQLIKKKKDNDNNYISELMDILKEKEELVYNLITEVEWMMKEDEGLVRDLIQKRKEKNKETKQLANKMSQDDRIIMNIYST